MSPVFILAILTTGLLFFLLLRRTNAAFTMMVGAICLLMWLLVIMGWMTSRAGQHFDLSLPDPGLLLFALICGGVALYAGWMGGEKSLKMTAIATGAVFLAIAVGWVAGGWNGDMRAIRILRIPQFTIGGGQSLAAFTGVETERDGVVIFQIGADVPGKTGVCTTAGGYFPTRSTQHIDTDIGITAQNIDTADSNRAIMAGQA